MSGKKLWSVCAVVALCVWVLAGPAAAANGKLVEIKSCHMASTEGLPIWLAIQKGWDKEEGLDIKMIYFDSGVAQVEGLAAKAWVVGATGAVGNLIGALRYETPMIAVVNTDSPTNAILVRPDSPIMKVKGWSKDHPNVYGSPETVKGKTIIATLISSSHFVMSKWLQVFGLTEKDVTIKNMDQAQAVAAFESGVGDAVSLWVPFQFIGEKKGWKKACDITDTGYEVTIPLFGDKKWCEEHPDLVAKYLRVYMRGANYITKQGEKAVPDLLRYYKEWAGFEISPEFATQELKLRRFYTYEEQLKLLDSSKGPSTVVKWQTDVADFFTDVGRFKKAERDKVVETPYISDKWLKQVKLPIPE